MTLDNRELAHRTLAQAFYLDGTLAVFVTGTLARPGYEVRIERLSPPMDPVQFAVVQRRIGGIFPEATNQYAVSGLFAMASYPRVVVVNHADGKDTVVAVDVRSEGAPPDSPHRPDVAVGAADVPGATLPLPYVFPPSATRSSRRTGTATGYSSAFDFGEALREAIAGLPPSVRPLSEYPRTVRVVEVGIEEGGVANFSHLYVRVRRHRSPQRN